ncbi:TPA: zinc-binding dehydrogenase, partial [Listeria monocytogenes]
AEVITTASAKNHELLKSLGADQVIDYKEVNFKDVLSDIDVVFDTMGGQIETDSYDVLKEGTGRLVSIVGISNEERAKEKNVTATGIWLQPNGEQLKELGKLLANKTIKPIVGATFPFSEKGVFDAHALSETHHAVGKIVISFNK